MTVPWYVFPTANGERAAKAIREWTGAGYNVAILTDGERIPTSMGETVRLHVVQYPGYWQSANMLCALAFSRTEVVVVGADDISPDPTKSGEEIAKELIAHFAYNGGLGVMQPTGDDWTDSQGRIIERICGSPWITRNWYLSMYLGRGPYWSGYKAFYGDEELQEVTKGADQLWQRPDVTQYHHHWMRPGGPPKQPYHNVNQQSWELDKRMFFDRKAAQFPGAFNF